MTMGGPTIADDDARGDSHRSLATGGALLLHFGKSRPLHPAAAAIDTTLMDE